MLYRIILLCSKIHIPTNLRVFLLRFLYPNISKNCRISNGIEIDIDSNNLYIGEGSYIGKESCIIGQHAQVRIGRNVMIAHRVNICVSTHPIMFGLGGVKRAGKTEWHDVTIGDNCWIGTGAIILPGVTIPSGCVVGAGSLVNKSLEANGLYAGVPAKRIKDLY